jgi:hypothetical protein
MTTQMIANDEFVRLLKKFIDKDDALKVRTTPEYFKSCSAWLMSDNPDVTLNYDRVADAVSEHVVGLMMFCKSIGLYNSTDPKTLIENILHESHGDKPCYCLPMVLSWYAEALDRATKHSIKMLDYI